MDALGCPALADQALGYLIELGPSDAGAIAAQVRHPDPLVRQRLVVALGHIGGHDAEQALTRAMTDTNTDVRSAARVALARQRQP